MDVTIDGVEYYQPECKCTPGMGHICYLRPKPQIVNISIDKILKATSTASGNQEYK